MATTTAVWALCRTCGFKRWFDRKSKAGYACQACGAPKPKTSPILARHLTNR